MHTGEGSSSFCQNTWEGGQGSRTIARGFPYFGFYCIFINKSFEICLGVGPMFTLPPHHPLCASMFGGHLMVPNSKEEAIFIGNYLAGIQVIIFLIQWTQINGITLGQTITDPINRMITITKYISYIKNAIERHLQLAKSGSF
jgi:hypothetical protein